MENNIQQNTLKRLQNKYRLVVMNDDTYEEVITFKLSRLSVYIGFSTILVLMIAFTIGLIAFTPIKYYIPGYGTRQSKADLQMLKIRTDSLEKAIQYKDQYLESLKKVLTGTTPTQKDTVPLIIEKKEISTF
ncbi:MAG TPA: hypothetical protein PLU36_08375 [Chitinophagaceae bacterium]|nr:hypothetical protein [Chitinophagaceae bacterium]MCC6636031.1 hypothetical protein [Chitinophagaceae bacterium]HMZ46803.1 hypothetical protein [Chitinophagaceae bacterium]HNJ58453.1 hypothetical protein [Chitinophagaceae bacterium]HNM33715.1 hypothetical protein [Chitinophagaceae bacterium]